MNSVFTAKLLQNLRNKKGNKGFTLIELLVVVIIIGVLAAVALPNLLGQVAKGRQAEAKNNLGAINRTQQAYRLEKAIFGYVGDTSAANYATQDATTTPPRTLPIALQLEYYEIGDKDVSADGALNTIAGVYAQAQDTYDTDIFDYQATTYQSGPNFASIICEEVALNSEGAFATDGTDPTSDGTASTCDVGNEVN